MAEAFKRKNEENIFINVKIDNGVTINSCYTILEELLKYILYQRHQIPLQLEVLQKTFQSMEESCEAHQEKLRSSDASISDQYIRKIYHSKEEILRVRKERRKKQWLLKVNQFIESYKKVLQVLKTELESGDVTAINFILGNSITTGTEVYSVLLPTEFRSFQKSSAYAERNASMQFFRAFITNSSLLRLVSRPCSLKKLWVMVQKKKNPISNDNWFSNTPASNSQNSLTIPCPHFQPSYRSKMVHVTLITPPNEMSMELTPSVGKGLIEHVCTPFMNTPLNRHRAFRNRKENLNLILTEGKCQNSSFASIFSHSPHLEEDEKIDQNYLGPTNKQTGCDFVFQTPIVHNSFESPCVNHLAITPCSRNIKSLHSKCQPRPIVETPTVPPSSGVKRLCLTNSPSKMLASKIDSFKLSDNSSQEFVVPNVISNAHPKMWFVIEQSIRGLKMLSKS